MLFPLPEYSVIEYGYGVSDGAVCPSCGQGKLFNAENKLRRCDTCFAAHQGMTRSVFAPNPTKEQDSRFDRYASLQHYAAPPVTGESAVAISDFVLDIDRDNLPDAAAEAGIAYHVLDTFAPGQVRLYFSGKKGFHLQVPAQVFGFTPSEMLGAVQRRMARTLQEDFGVEVDPTAYSRARLFRRVGSRHSGTGRFKVEILPSQLADIDALCAYARKPQPALNLSPAVSTPQARAWYEDALRQEVEFRRQQEQLDHQPAVELSEGEYHPCATNLLNSGPPAEGTRHRTYITLASYFKSAGLSKEEALALLVPWTQEHPTTHTSKSRREMRFEMQADVRSVYASPRIKFHCQYAMALHACSARCPLFVPLPDTESV